ncbi:hypothetical protein [Streptomyces sp. NRRL F-2580]|uniref:hypothetical protein n=1 Tax=Streptomyces sp. NRRL F-2580 TaxID=1463841 RepID=UPI0004C6312D|nr:hypothetical protein [Streptomyces sp. NRRL F-2580]
MSDYATYLLGGPDGYTGHADEWGAICLDLDLLAGPDVLLPLLEAGTRTPVDWGADDFVQSGVLADPGRKVLLFFAVEGPAASSRTRAAFLAMLGHAWPGWEVRWAHDGQADLRRYLGEPVEDHGHPIFSFEGSAIGPDDRTLTLADPPTTVVTIGADRCHVLTDIVDLAVAGGSGLLGRLDDAPRHEAYRTYAQGGIHIDPEHRRVGWWLSGTHEYVRTPAAAWEGWTVEFWGDRWWEQTRASGGRFDPPVPDRAAALAEVRDEALRYWTGSRNGDPAGVIALAGLSQVACLTARQAPAARAAIERAHAAAAGL